jgi:FKBP-type peptidyl-prolyl cis-trans isomerase
MTVKMVMKWMIVLAIGFIGAKAYSEEIPSLKTQKDKVNYSIGVGVARNFQRQEIDVDMNLVTEGMKDAFSGGKLLMTEEDIRATLNTFQNELRMKQEAKRSIAGEDNKKAGDTFLAENSKKDGVITLPSGLQYKIIIAGNGKKPLETDKVEIKYRGTLLDGKEFDNSERSGQPSVTLELKGFVSGLKEALKLMPAGSTWQLFVPPQLAYGQRGSGVDIGPNAALIFEIELLSVK